MLIFDILDKKPDFVNEEGVKWGKENTLTNYAQKSNIFNIALPNITCYIVEFPDKKRSYVLVDNEKGLPIEENSSLEGMGIKIDLLKRLKADEDVNVK